MSRAAGWVALSAVLLAACVSSTQPTAVGPRSEQPPQGSNPGLRVMTYNIKRGQSNTPCTQPPVLPDQPPSPSCNLDLDGTIAVLRAHAPEIVALQEVDRFWARSGYADQPAVIAAGLGMAHSCFAPNLDHAPDNHSNRPHQYGTALLSRYPVHSCSHTLLTTFAGWEQRGIVGAVVTMRGVRVRVFSTHLQASGTVVSAAPQRVLQVRDIISLLSAAGEPVVLMGDFNAGSTSEELTPLSTRLIDLWQVAGTGPGNTSPAQLTGDPTSRIDYIFASPGTTISSVTVPIDMQTRVASDHYPVVADIVLPGLLPGVARKAEGGASPSHPDGKGGNH